MLWLYFHFILSFMRLPDPLQHAIDSLVRESPFPDIEKAREELTERYRQEARKEYISSKAHRLSYVATRVPATYQVNHKVLGELALHASNHELRSLLDLGSGPGSVMWAASHVLSTLDKIQLIERDKELGLIGKKLALHSAQQSVRNACWEFEDLKRWQVKESFDLVTLSYVIGELTDEENRTLIEKGWEAANKFFVIIEPGTPAGFERIRKARTHLISLGAQVIAPCPHNASCPMAGQDWCHFSARVERSFIHRRAKQATLGIEDEKFSYVIVSKILSILPKARVLSHPLKRPGHIYLKLCTEEGLKQEIVSKKRGDFYKIARKLEWGDIVEI